MDHPDPPVLAYMQYGARRESVIRWATGPDAVRLAYSVAANMIEDGAAAPVSITYAGATLTMDDLAEQYGPWWKNA